MARGSIFEVLQYFCFKYSNISGDLMLCINFLLVYTETKLLVATFQAIFFRLSGNKIEMNFCQNLCISIDESLVVLWNSFIRPNRFWVQKC